MGVAACHARLAGKLPGPGPGGPVQPRKWPTARERGVLMARSPRIVHVHDGAVARSPAARWWLAGGNVLPVSLRGPPEGHRARRWGWSSPKRWCGVEAVEKSPDSGVRRWGESFGGWWQWRRRSTVSMWKRECEGGLNWGQQWQMVGSHHEAAEVLAFGWEPKRRRGLRRREPVRRTYRRWRRGEELELGHGRKENGEKRERVAAGGFSSTSVTWCSEGKKDGGPTGAAVWQKEKEERGPQARQSAARGG
jgi:hypothetical protein